MARALAVVSAVTLLAVICVMAAMALGNLVANSDGASAESLGWVYVAFELSALVFVLGGLITTVLLFTQPDRWVLVPTAVAAPLLIVFAYGVTHLGPTPDATHERAATAAYASLLGILLCLLLNAAIGSVAAWRGIRAQSTQVGSGEPIPQQTES